MFQLPGPGIVSLPSLLNRRLHDSGLPQVSLLSDLRAGQYAAQEQRHIEGLFQLRLLCRPKPHQFGYARAQG